MNAVNVFIIGAIITALATIVAAIISKSHTSRPNLDSLNEYHQSQWITMTPSLPNIDQFLGKQYILETVKKRLLQNNGERILITGVPGIGKKFHCRILANKLQSQGRFHNIGYFSCKGDSTITHQIGKQLIIDKPHVRLHSIKDLSAVFIRPVH